MKRRLVCILSPPAGAASAGGVERFSELVGAALETAGWETAFLAPPSPRPRAQRLGVQPFLDSHALRAAVGRQSPDLVISNGFLGGRVPYPHVHVFHGTMVAHLRASLGEISWHHALRMSLTSGLAERMAANGARTVAVSPSAAAEIRRFYRHVVDDVIPNGVDTQRFSPAVPREQARRMLGLPPTEPLALFVGRLEHRKGGDLVERACAAAGVRLVVAGASAPATALHLGVLCPDQVALAYRAASCVAFPTRYEACSFAVLEALASGTPLVTTDRGYMPEIVAAVPSYRPLLVEPTVASTAAGIRRSLTLPDAAPPIRDARQFVEQRASLDVFAARWLALVDQVAGPRAEPFAAPSSPRGGDERGRGRPPRTT